MKKIDFTHPGGFPLTQEQLDYLQSAYTKCIHALGAAGVNGTQPVIVSGMAITYPAANTTSITDGWLLYNGEMIPFTGSTVTATGTDVALVTVVPSSTNLTYNDGSIYPALLGSTAVLGTGASVTDATHFPVSALKTIQQGFGELGREANWNSLAVATSSANGSVNGTIYYKKNFITNTLHIRASLDAFAAQNFAASPGAAFVAMGTLPAGYWPNNVAYFTSYYFAGNLFKDDLGVSWIKALTSSINATGQIGINFLRPDISIPAYEVIFNTIIPLD